MQKFKFIFILWTFISFINCCKLIAWLLISLCLHTKKFLNLSIISVSFIIFIAINSNISFSLFYGHIKFFPYFLFRHFAIRVDIWLCWKWGVSVCGGGWGVWFPVNWLETHFSFFLHKLICLPVYIEKLTGHPHSLYEVQTRRHYLQWYLFHFVPGQKQPHRDIYIEYGICWPFDTWLTMIVSKIESDLMKLKSNVFIPGQGILQFNDW